MPGVRSGLYVVRREKNGYSPFARQLGVLSVHQKLDVSLPPLAEDAPRGIGGWALAALWPGAQIPPSSTSSLNFNNRRAATNRERLPLPAIRTSLTIRSP
jgi:hypothetical protein